MYTTAICIKQNQRCKLNTTIVEGFTAPLELILTQKFFEVV